MKRGGHIFRIPALVLRDIDHRTSRRLDGDHRIRQAQHSHLISTQMEADYGFGGQEDHGPQPHPYLHEPLLHITNLPAYVTDEMLALAFMYCGPFRPKIQRTVAPVLSGTIEFKFLERGAHTRGLWMLQLN